MKKAGIILSSVILFLSLVLTVSAVGRDEITLEGVNVNGSVVTEKAGDYSITVNKTIAVADNNEYADVTLSVLVAYNPPDVPPTGGNEFVLPVVLLLFGSATLVYFTREKFGKALIVLMLVIGCIPFAPSVIKAAKDPLYEVEIDDVFSDDALACFYFDGVLSANAAEVNLQSTSGVTTGLIWKPKAAASKQELKYRLSLFEVVEDSYLGKNIYTSKTSLKFTDSSTKVTTVKYYDDVGVLIKAKLKLTLSYDANLQGATGTMTAHSVYAKTAITVKDCSFQRTDYEFVSWNTKADGSGTEYKPGDLYLNIEEDVVLYAQWVPIEYVTITYMINHESGSGVSPLIISVRKGESHVVLHEIQTGFAVPWLNILSWFSNPELTGNEVFPLSTIIVNENIILYANWGSEG